MSDETEAVAKAETKRSTSWLDLTRLDLMFAETETVAREEEAKGSTGWLDLARLESLLAASPAIAEPAAGAEPAAAAPVAAPAAAPADADAPELWTWRAVLLGVTALWGANFAIVKQAADSMGSEAEAVALFTAARFLLGSAVLVPAVPFCSSRAAAAAGLQVGLLLTAGYGAQVAALALGTQAGTAAFICSLNTVVVALAAGARTGCVPRRTWWAIALAVLGVACLELPSVLGGGGGGGGGGGVCVGDLVALGQPLGFGAAYVLTEEALAEHPEDELPIAALQILTTCAAALGAACAAYGAPLWELPWGDLLPRGDDWLVPGALFYSGAVCTGVTIWLQMLVFAKLPAVDCSVLLTTEPLWAALAAVALLGDRLGPHEYAGGTLILVALAVQQGLLPGGGGAAAAAAEERAQ